MPGTVADLAEEAFTRAPMNRPLQALFVALFAVPQLAIYALQPDSSAYLELAGLLKPAVLLSSWQRWLQDPKFILVLVLLSFERFVYTMVWLFPAHFVHFAQMYIRPLLLKTTGKGKPLDCIVSLFWLSKIFQFGSMFGFYFSVGPLPAVASISLFRWVLGLQLMLLGQLLNAAIYNAIGKAGVYYGYKIGVPVPWCTGFPFNVFTMHPQYMGVCMSIVGGGILMVTEEQAYAGFVGVGLSATLFYLYMSMVEDMPCEHPADKTQGGPTKDRRLRDLRNLKWSTHLSKTWDTTDNVLGFMARPWFPTVVAAAALLNCFLLVVPVNLLFVVFCIRNSYSVLPSALNVAGGAPQPADAKLPAPPRVAPTAAPPTSSTPISSTLLSPRPPRPPHPPYTHPTPTRAPAPAAVAPPRTHTHSRPPLCAGAGVAIGVALLAWAVETSGGADADKICLGGICLAMPAEQIKSHWPITYEWIMEKGLNGCISAFCFAHPLPIVCFAIWKSTGVPVPALIIAAAISIFVYYSLLGAGAVAVTGLMRRAYHVVFDAFDPENTIPSTAAQPSPSGGAKRRATSSPRRGPSSSPARSKSPRRASKAK